MACGIKDSGQPDLALVATAEGRAVTAAAVFTTNRACAAPVQVSRRHLAGTGGRAAAVVLNSGNANAATGVPGLEAAAASCAGVAAALGCDAAEVLVCSTGLIGIPMDAAPIVGASARLVAGTTADAAGGERAARAIMTTDTRSKQTSIDGGGFTVGGMAKGAAMLAPDMATMLAVLTTDAEVDEPGLRAALGAAVDRSFNSLSVDGCTSTNDTVIVLAGGSAGPVPADALAAALAAGCLDLASQMAMDAEGATKLVRVTVTGAASEAEARAAARKVAQSQLCKCSWYGQDPYWGRVASELGSAGVAYDHDRLAVAYGGVTVARGGVSVAHGADAIAGVMASREIDLTADLGLGGGRWTILTNDLTHGYVDENMGTS
jgi:glutamate N-acetyltransferase/amino-acid N-acetyltransferase